MDVTRPSVLLRLVLAGLLLSVVVARQAPAKAKPKTSTLVFVIADADDSNEANPPPTPKQSASQVVLDAHVEPSANQHVARQPSSRPATTTERKNLPPAPAPVQLSAAANVRRQALLLAKSPAEQEEQSAADPPQAVAHALQSEQVEQHPSKNSASRKKPDAPLGEELILRPATNQPQTETQAEHEQPDARNVQPQQRPKSRPKPRGIGQKSANPQVEDQPLDPIAERLVHAHALAQHADTLDEFSEVVRLCREAIQLGVEQEQLQFTRKLASWALNHRGQLYSDDGQGDLALADFKAALRLSPNNWRALHNLGVSRAQGAEFADAFDDFNRVIQLNPKFAKAYCNRATLYVQAKAVQAALDDYTRATQLEPALFAAQVGRGRTCHLLGKLDEALESFVAAIRLQPYNANLHCSRADLLADMGRYDQALDDYARAIELNPEFAHAYRNGAWLLATCPDGRIRDAKNALLGAQRALQFDYGQRHVALDTLAAAQANAGQFEEAVPTISQAIELAPQSTKVIYQARLALYQQRLPFRIQPLEKVSQAAYQSGDE